MHGAYLLDFRNLDDPAEAELAAGWLAEQEELRDEWAGEVERLPDVAPGLGLGGVIEIAEVEQVGAAAPRSSPTTTTSARGVGISNEPFPQAAAIWPEIAAC